jgi:hypothetical protein
MPMAHPPGFSAALSMNFDSFLHKVTFRCDNPVKFKDFIEVKTKRAGWWLANKDGSLRNSVVV